MEELNDNLKRLRELSEKVVPLIDITKLEDHSAIYQTNQGDCKGIALFHIDKVAVQYATMEESTEMVCHDHGEREILILVEGDLEVSTPSGIVQAELGIPIVIHPNQEHIAKSTTGCSLIAITIPASKAYPT